jgi:hypothetical protein
VLQILNVLVAAFGGVFLLSIFRRTDTRALIPHQISEVQSEKHRHRFRTLDDVRMLRSSKTETGGSVA